VLLPTSAWVPTVNTQFTQFGLNTAPYTLTVSAPAGERALSGGAASGTTYSQPLNGFPFVIAANYGAPISRDAAGITLEAWIPEGASPAARAGAERLLDEAAKIAAFYSKALGPAPQATFRLIASDGAAGFAAPGGTALATRVFSRSFVDAETYEQIADGLARVWIEGAAPIRGMVPGTVDNRTDGVGMLRDALPRYLAVVALGDRFGEAAERAAFDRLRAGLSGMGPLATSVQLGLVLPGIDPAYYGLMRTKGPLVFRLVAHEAGGDQMLAAVRTALGAARQKRALTLDDLRAALSASAGRDLAPLFATWVDTVVEPDLIVGVPQQAGGAWASALRNLGTGDVAVDVVAVTEGGNRVVSRVTVPSQGFGEARFETTERIATVEVDPDKLVPQSNYANDARPQRPDPSALFGEGVELVKRRDFAQAEPKLRAVVAAQPANAEAKAWLARALLGLNRNADAERVAREALDVEPPPIDSVAWSHVVLGQSALAGGKSAEAIDHFRTAAASAAEISALKASREGLVAAERAAGQAPKVDESVARYFSEFDRAVSAGVNTAQASQLVDAALLPDFVKGLVTALPRKWTTEIARAEMIDADEALVDAKFVVAAASGNTSATVLLRLRRVGGAWKLVDVQALETS
jgi:hypothetical protein